MQPKKVLHEVIREDILEKILNKTYKLGEKIPNEIDIASDYGVSRPTVRQAIQSLVNEGYLERIKRRGTFIRERKINQEFTHQIRSYADEIQSKGLLPATKIISFTVEQANAEVATQLELSENDKVYKLTRLRFAGKQPVVLVSTYLPFDLLDTLIDVDFTTISLYSKLTELGFPVVSIQRKLEVIKSDELSSSLLNISSNEPLFYFHSTGYSNKSKPVEYSISWYRGDLNSFEFKIDL